MCQQLLFTEESFWTWHGKSAHTIAFYYTICLVDESDFSVFYPNLRQKENDKILIKWVSMKELKNITIYPTFLKEKFKSTGKIYPEHIISVE